VKGKGLQTQENKQTDKGVNLIRLLCSCGKRVKVSPKFAGKQGKCPRCGKAVQIPSKDVLDRKYNEFRNKNDEQDIFEIPSLPELKQVSLEEPTKKKSILQLTEQEALETTGELQEIFDDLERDLQVPSDIVASGLPVFSNFIIDDEDTYIPPSQSSSDIGSHRTILPTQKNIKSDFKLPPIDEDVKNLSFESKNIKDQENILNDVPLDNFHDEFMDSEEFEDFGVFSKPSPNISFDEDEFDDLPSPLSTSEDELDDLPSPLSTSEDELDDLPSPLSTSEDGLDDLPSPLSTSEDELDEVESLPNPEEDTFDDLISSLPSSEDELDEVKALPSPEDALDAIESLPSPEDALDALDAVESLPSSENELDDFPSPESVPKVDSEDEFDIDSFESPEIVMKPLEELEGAPVAEPVNGDIEDFDKILMNTDDQEDSFDEMAESAVIADEHISEDLNIPLAEESFDDEMLQTVSLEQASEFPQAVSLDQEDDLPQAVSLEQDDEVPQAVSLEQENVAELQIPVSHIEEVDSHGFMHSSSDIFPLSEDRQGFIDKQEQEFIEKLEEYEDQLRQSESMEAISFERKATKEMKADIEHIVVHLPENVGENVLEGYKSLQNFNFEEALQYLSACIFSGEDMSVAYYLRGVVYIRKKLWHAALEDLENARATGYPEIEIEETINQVTYQIALEYRNMGAYGEALLYLDKIESRNINQEKGRIYWMRAKSYLRVEAWVAALHDLEEAILHNYARPEVFEARGQIYLQQKDYESAMHNFSAAITHGTKNANLYYLRAQAYFFCSDLENAYNDIQKAKELQPQNAEFFDLEGLILNQKKMYKESEEAFEKALELDPSSVHHFNRALAYMRRERYDKAIDDFSMVLFQNPLDVAAYFQRAICYQEKKNPNLALARQDFQKVEELTKKSLYRTQNNQSGKEIL